LIVSNLISRTQKQALAYTARREREREEEEETHKNVTLCNVALQKKASPKSLLLCKCLT
jgi:hypothetical protein